MENRLFFPEKTTYEDVFYIKLLGYYMKDTVILPEHFYHYRVHKDSTTHAISTQTMRERVAIEIKILDELEKRGLERVPFSKETNAEFLSRGILKNMLAWYQKAKERPDGQTMELLRRTVKARLPQYQKSLEMFGRKDRARIWLFLQMPWLFLLYAECSLKFGKKTESWGDIPIGFCSGNSGKIK